MASLTSCLKKLDRVISAEDAALIRSATDDLKSDGIKGTQAATQAIDEMIDTILLERLGIAGKVTDAGGKAPLPPAYEGPDAIEDRWAHLTTMFADFFSDPENSFKSITDARRFAAENGVDVAAGTQDAKRMEEAMELALVLTSHEMVQNADLALHAYDDLVNLYARQPKLGSRTSKSMVDQAYSTPMPLAYLTSRLGRVSDANVIYEPTAGNGSLLIEALPDSQNVIANEIDPTRTDALKAQGFKVTSQNAVLPQQAKAIRQSLQGADTVIMNPPFGAVKGPDGKSEKFRVGELNTTQIDHAIALQALEAMRDDGRAVMILGSINKLVKGDKARAEAYNAAAKRKFYWFLYNKYNVVDHFTVSGALYEKQGAGWPVDVIVVDGKGKSSRALPAIEPPSVLTSWEDLKGKLEDAESETRVPRSDREPVVGTPTGEQQLEGGRPGDTGADVGGRPAEQLAGAEDVEPVRVRERPDHGERSGLRKQQPGKSYRERLETRRREQRDRTGESPDTVEGEEVLQVDYEPASEMTPMGTLVPPPMKTATENALVEVEDLRGSHAEFVAKELDYDVSELSKYFGGEQVDALALAIHQIKRGKAFIVGDQTGTGKGRQVAGIMRWAMIHKHTPIFFTEKPNLYSDIMRDLIAIGTEDYLGRPVNPMITNTDESVPVDDEAKLWSMAKLEAQANGEKAPKKQGRFIQSKKKTAQINDQMTEILANGLGEFDIIFTTYDQMNTYKGEETSRRHFINNLRHKAVFGFDESHNAFGTQAGDRAPKPNEGDAPNRATLIRRFAQDSFGVFFSSATYAKRPDGMDLYGRTDLGDAVENLADLGAVISKGGVPMQQIVAQMLADSGQYVRREKSFDGIVYDPEVLPVSEEAYDMFSHSLKQIVDAEKLLLADPGYKDWLKEFVQEGAATAMDTAVGDIGVTQSGFSSLMHNLITQFLLGLKADIAADQAIAKIEQGKGMKPVLTLSRTNESFIDKYAEANDIKIGDAIDITFSDAVQNYLDRTRRVTLKMPDESKVHRDFPIERATVATRAAYENAKHQIEQIQDVPASPLDHIIDKVERAGYRIGEISGRSTKLVYDADGKATLQTRPSMEKSVAGKVALLNGFNNGGVDALLLTRSGSTGLSAHSAPEFKDLRPRWMIIVSPEDNIDTHMQLLGRINRHGQVNLPGYTQLVADVPAEMRPAAILAKKMASLAANTTGARKSAFEADIADFMNQYGDEVVRNVLNENPEWLFTLLPGGMPDSHTGLAGKVTGKLIFLPVKDQRSFLDQVLQAYKEKIEYLDAIGDNELEAKFVDLKAETLDRETLKEAEGESPFQQAVYMEKISMVAPGKAMKPEQIAADLAKALDLEMPESPVDALRDRGRFTDRRMEKAREWHTEIADRQTAYANQQIASAKTDETKAKLRTRYRELEERFRSIGRLLHVGNVINVEINGEMVPAVVLDVKRVGKADTPMALSSQRAKLAIPMSASTISMTFSAVAVESDPDDVKARSSLVSPRSYDQSPADIMGMFETAATSAREERYMITGNIVSGFDLAGGKGRIMNFTDTQGDVKPGVLMAAGYDHDNFMQNRPIRFKEAGQLMEFMDRVQSPEVKSTDDIVTVLQVDQNTIEIEMPKSRRQGGKYFLQTNVREAANDEFAGVGNRMRWRGPKGTAVNILDAMMEHGAMFQTRSDQDIAMEIVKGGPAPEPDRPQGLNKNILYDIDRLPDGPRKGGRERVNSAAFKRWFGDSKVVDENGNPLVVHHGTDQDFEAFSKEARGVNTNAQDAKMAFFFTDSPSVAASYAADYSGYDENRAISTLNKITRGYYAAFNEKILKVLRKPPQIRKARTLNTYLRMESPYIVNLLDRPYNEDVFAEKITIARDAGFDGVIFKNVYDDGPYAELMELDKGDVYVVFEPNQVKSTDNVGTYSATDDRMRYSLAPKAGKPLVFRDRVLEMRAEMTAGIEEQARILLGHSVRVEIHENLENYNDAQGVYIDRVIWLAMGMMEDPIRVYDTLHHESIHALRDIDAFTPSEWSILERMANSVWMEEHNIREQYELHYADKFDLAVGSPELEEMLREEAIAEGFVKFIQDGVVPLESGRVRALFEKLKRFLVRLGNYLRGKGFTTVDDIFTDVERGETARRDRVDRTPPPAPDDGPPAGGRMAVNFTNRAGERETRPFVAPMDMSVENWVDHDRPLLSRIAGATSNWLPSAINPNFTAIRRTLQDRFIDLKRFQKAIAEQRGEAVAESMDVYMAESLYYGRTGQRLDDLRNDMIKPLIDRAAALGLTREEIDLFLYAKHAAERNAYIASINDKFPDGGSGMTNAEAFDIQEAFARKGKLAGLQEISVMAQEIIEMDRKNRLKAGLIDRETYDQWSTQYANYVPLRGWENDPEADTSSGRLRTGKRYDVRGMEAHPAYGRRTRADSPLAYIFAQAQQGVVRAEKNRVGKTFYRLVKNNPNGAVWKINERVTKTVIDDSTGMTKEVFDRTHKLADNVFAVKIGGKTQYITIEHPPMARAMKGLGTDSAGWFVRNLLMPLNKHLSFVNTALNPEFVISNMARDLQTALAHLTETEVAGIRRKVLADVTTGKALKGAWKGLQGDTDSEWALHFRDYADHGGKVSFFGLETIEDIKNQIKNDFADISPTNARKLLKGGRKVLDVIEHLNQTVENGVRLATYVRLREAGVSKAKAASAARELTVNFNRKGNAGPTLNALYLFYNAGVQGNTRMLQALWKSKKLKVIAAGIVGLAATLDSLNRMAADDDEDGKNLYDKIPTWVKERNMIIMLPDFMNPFEKKGEYIQIPLPYGYNLFHVMGQNASSVLWGEKDPLQATADIGATFLNAFNPVGGASTIASMISPTITDPMVDMLSNKNWFGGPIYPHQYQREGRQKPPSEQYFSSVGVQFREPARWLNELTGGSAVRPGSVSVSPETMEYMWDFIAGGAGMFVSRSASAAMKLYNGEDMELREIPFLRKVVSSKSKYIDRSAFYEIADQVMMVDREIKTYRKAGNGEKVRQVQRTYTTEMRMIGMVKSAENQLKQLRKKQRAVKQSNIGADARMRVMDTIDNRMDGVMLRVRKRFYQMEGNRE